MFLATSALAEVDLPEFPGNQPIFISAEAANRWQQGSYEVWVLRGHCLITQGAGAARCQEAVLWIDRADVTTRQRNKVIAYLEGGVTIEAQRGGRPFKLADATWLGRFFSSATVEVRAGIVAGCPNVLPGVYQRGMERRSPAGADVVHSSRVEVAQFAAPPSTPSSSRTGMLRTGTPVAGTPIVGTPLPPGTRRVRVFPRGDVPVQAQWIPNPQTNESVAIIESGVNLVVDGVAGFGSIDVSTDRLVLWTRSQHEPDLSGQTPQEDRQPLEIYMEGNVVFRQGERVIYANRMYYDVPNKIGTVLDADMLTPAPQYAGLLRLHAQILQQTSPDRYFAQNAFFTSSRLGVPEYRMQSNDVTFEDIQHPILDQASGQPLMNPITHEPAIEHERFMTARDDFLYVEGVPVFYWPVIATDLNEPTFYLRRIQYKDDAVFGSQILTHWNMYQLLGIHKPPPNTNWDLGLDYLGSRGFGAGTTFLYHPADLFGIPGKTNGLAEFWGLDDHGFDNLGTDRSHLAPEADYRYFFHLNHLQEMPDGGKTDAAGFWEHGFQLALEGGVTSDRNFLQEFEKGEWDEQKDQSTDVELKRFDDNASWNVFASARTEDFFTQTVWLPRADHFWLGQSLLGDSLTWYEHSSVGYAQLDRLSPPSNPNDQPFSYLPWEANNREGSRLLSRQELDLPMQLGPVKVVPYALGELGHWGEDINGQSLDRAYGMAGVRATLPMWCVDPTVESSLWNVPGLAHKVDFEMDLFASGTNHPLTDLPLYDPLDDWSIEAWQRRLATLTYNWPATFPPTPNVAVTPAQVDERFYALRYGMGGWVTAPSMEIADDLEELRLGIHQRWQTKRGPPDNYHIIDWIEFNTDITFYPDPNRDNFGDVAGLADYDFRWHVGDRLTLVSDGNFDFFDYGEKEVTFGAFLSRPPRGNLYVGFRLLEGPISEELVTMSYNYLMSPKWMATYSTSFVINDTKDIGANLRITRIGESLLVGGGITYDPVYNTWGAEFFIEPRFLPKGNMPQTGGTKIPIAGVNGLE